METTPAGSAPVPAPTAEPKVVSQTPAAPAPGSSLPATDTLKKLEGAKTRQELQAFTEQLLSEAVANKPATPPAETPAAPAEPAAAPAADPTAPAAPAAPADPEAPVDPEAPEAAAPAAPAVDPEEPVLGDEPDDVTPAAPGRHRLAINKDDEVGLMASAFKRRNKDWTMKQCVEAAEAKLGVAKPAAPATDPAKPAEPQLPVTVEATNSEILKLVALKKEAAAGLRVDEMADIDEKLAALREHKLDLREAQIQQRQQADIAYQTKFEESDRLAAETYRFATVPTSPAGKRMQEINEAMERLGDPRFYDPNRPMLIANMVAAEFNIAPLSKNKADPKPQAKAAAPATEPKKGILPSGGSSTAPAAPAVNADVERFTKISTPADLKAEYKRLGLQMP